nr:vacuolar protein-sorting-associated protein 33 homolog [Ipomoea batatas]
MCFHELSLQSGFASSPSFDNLQGSAHNSDKVGDGRRSVVLVVFIGGVTFAEINALRFLSSQVYINSLIN